MMKTVLMYKISIIKSHKILKSILNLFNDCIINSKHVITTENNTNNNSNVLIQKDIIHVLNYLKDNEQLLMNIQLFDFKETVEPEFHHQINLEFDFLKDQLFNDSIYHNNNDFLGHKNTHISNDLSNNGPNHYSTNQDDYHIQSIFNHQYEIGQVKCYYHGVDLNIEKNNGQDIISMLNELVINKQNVVFFDIINLYNQINLMIKKEALLVNKKNITIFKENIIELLIDYLNYIMLKYDVALQKRHFNDLLQLNQLKNVIELQIKYFEEDL